MMQKQSDKIIPKGFLFSTAEAAIKKPGRKDIAVIFSETEANIAGTFTTNMVKAAPVKMCMRRMRSGRGQAIIVNSGNANACTGKQGLRDAGEIVSALARQIGIRSSLVFPCSTGVIGTPLPMERIRPSISALADGLGHSSLDDVARAIMTTDTFPKIIHKRVRIGSRTGTISGICKGAGMIAPNMATMLCFIITDIAVDRKTLAYLVKDSVAKSFNRITIDGDMSTNDTLLLMSNGLVGNTPIDRKSEFFGPLQKVVDEVAYELSRLVVKDGEGATKLIEVVVKGARSRSDAEKAAFSVANSSLVKTAVYGNDANWGRIMCALGYSGAAFREEKTDIFFGPVKVVKDGLTNRKDTEAARVLRGKEVVITVDFHLGKAAARVLTCDFTEGYVHINAEYRT
jgi:glutamate N-acetyltransferase/amino-acid N-acetyltransferase